MGAQPLPSTDLVSDPSTGLAHVGTTDSPRRRNKEEDALLRRKLDGVGVFLAGPANVALQLSWPEVGYGVVESPVESGQVYRHPFKRFRTTIGYIGVAMYGSPDLQHAYRQAVNGAHRQVRSGPESPVKYNAFNRDLQLWVASCLFYGLRDIAVRMHGPMSDAEEETLLQASGRLGTTLQVPDDMWHRDMASFWAYWEEGIARSRIDEPVGEYVLGVLDGKLIPQPLGLVAGRPLQWVNTGFLPPEIRDQLGLQWTARDQRNHDRLLRALGLASGALPSPLKLFPMNAMMWNIQLRRTLGRPLV